MYETNYAENKLHLHPKIKENKLYQGLSSPVVLVRFPIGMATPHSPPTVDDKAKMEGG